MGNSVFEKRQKNFWNLMDQNAEKRTLTKKQHAVLAYLSNLRHQLHTSQKDLFNDESGTPLWREYNSIDKELIKSGLEPIGLPDYTEAFTTSMDYENDDKGLSYEEWYEENFFVFGDEMEEINNMIEKYLEDIDKKHGTKYAPTGRARLY